jgi:hypothetical protein
MSDYNYLRNRLPPTPGQADDGYSGDKQRRGQGNLPLLIGGGALVVIVLVAFMSIGGGAKTEPSTAAFPPGIADDGTFEYTFNSKPLGVSLGPAGKNKGLKVTKVKESRPPIEAGDVFVKLNGESVSQMAFKDIAALLKDANPPINVLFVRPTTHKGL